ELVVLPLPKQAPAVPADHRFPGAGAPSRRQGPKCI
ncbi:MAG: hypothetical protein AVDCRST_MAG93-2668, partial [uncultured Chloroflexia bacterium]